jgi:hypothetical protein
LRYQVVDPDKAVIVHDSENPPTIIDEATGERLDTPWMDHHSTGKLTAGVTYYELLVNPAGVIKPGSVVSIAIGGARLEHVLVK